MAYGDYIDATTMLDTCDADVSAPSGKGVDCRFVAQSEEATTAAVNRASLAIAQNSDELKARLDADVAVTQVETLTGFSGSTIDIDPTGGAAGDINFTGSLYLGNGSYSANQESRDTLFQLLDSEYNEVMVEGVEVQVGLTSVAPGSGFYSAGVVTLTLNATLPSGDYKLSYAIGSTIATLPDDALIRADIRGLHEAPGESQRNAFYVCAFNTDEGPADFIGASAVADALATIKGVIGISSLTIYVREGVYTAPAAWAGVTNVRIVGSGSAQEAEFTVASDLDVNGDNCVFENIKFSVGTGFELTLSSTSGALINCVVVATSPNGNENVRLGSFCSMVGCTLSDCDVVITSGGHAKVEDCSILGYGRAFGLGDASKATIRNCTITSNATATPTALVELFDAGGGAPSNVLMESCVLACTGFPCLQLAGFGIGFNLENVTIRNCDFTANNATAVSVLQKYIETVRFEQCSLTRSGTGAGAALTIDGANAVEGTNTVFDGCTIYNYATGALAVDTSNDPRGLAFLNCHFEHKGATNTVGLVNLNHSEEKRGVIRNCTFVPADLVLASGQDIYLHELDGGDLRIEYLTSKPYDGAYVGLRIDDCHLESVVVDFGPTACTSLTGSAAVDIKNNARVADLIMLNMRGTWSMPLITLSSGFADRRATLDGLRLDPATSGLWTNNVSNEPLVVELGNRSVLRRFRWKPSGLDTTTGIDYVVGTINGSTIDDVVVEDCYVDLSISGVPTDFYGIFRLGSASNKSSLVRFVRNHVVGGNATESCTYSVRLYTDGALIESNVIHHGLIPAGVGEVNNGTALLINDGYRNKVANNEIGGYILTPTPTNGERKVLYQSSTGGIGGIVHSATLIHNNIFRDLAAGIQAYIGSSAGFHPTGGLFAGHVDDTNHFMSA